MTTSGTEPVLNFVMKTVESEWTKVQPPTYWTTVKDAGWPTFGPDAEEMIAADSPERHFVRFWVDSVGQNAFAEENVGYLYPFVRVWTCYVVKGSADLQEEMAMATATMQALYLGNPDRVNPEYTGTNTWGLFTRQSPGVPIQWRYPKVGASYGIGFVWGAFDIGYQHPWPKG